MSEITLYSTEGCHLCEMAYDLLRQAHVIHWVKVVDIAFDETLFSRYGVTIPVVSHRQSELNWPFNFNELTQWLEKHGIDHHS